MKQVIDCVLVGFKEYDINMRVLAAQQNDAAYINARFQYINYKNRKIYYDQFLSSFLYDDRISINEIPYYGILYLYSFLVSSGLSVRYFNYFDADKDKIVHLLQEYDVRMVAISSVYYTDPYPLIQLIHFFRKQSPYTKIAVGGAYIYNQYLELDQTEFIRELELIDADFYICDAQGEKALSDLCFAEKNGTEKFTHINNLIYKENDRYYYTEFVREHNSLENNQIDWSLFTNSGLGAVTNVRTSRGCLYNCNFCNYPIRNSPFEIDTISNIVHQLEQLKKIRGLKYIVFIDDSFNVPLDRFKAICRCIINRKLDLKWFSYFRLNCCDEEAVQLMKESGCQGVFLGLESGNNSVLKNMNKHTSTQIYTKGIQQLKRNGILTFGYFMVGFPGESIETIKDTVNFINKTGIDYYSFNLWYAEPETPVYKYTDEFGLKGQGFSWRHNTLNARQAAELMKYFFENVNRKTIYIPGENFSFWGIPYLLGKGYKLDDINCILRILQNSVGIEENISDFSVQRIAKIIRGKNENI